MACSVNFEAAGLTRKEGNKGLVSKETVVLRQWGRETLNFGFIN